MDFLLEPDRHVVIENSLQSILIPDLTRIVANYDSEILKQGSEVNSMDVCQRIYLAQITKVNCPRQCVSVSYWLDAEFWRRNLFTHFPTLKKKSRWSNQPAFSVFAKWFIVYAKQRSLLRNLKKHILMITILIALILLCIVITVIFPALIYLINWNASLTATNFFCEDPTLF